MSMFLYYLALFCQVGEANLFQELQGTWVSESKDLLTFTSKKSHSVDLEGGDSLVFYKTSDLSGSYAILSNEFIFLKSEEALSLFSVAIKNEMLLLQQLDNNQNPVGDIAKYSRFNQPTLDFTDYKTLSRAKGYWKMFIAKKGEIDKASYFITYLSSKKVDTFNTEETKKEFHYYDLRNKAGSNPFNSYSFTDNGQIAFKDQRPSGTFMNIFDYKFIEDDAFVVLTDKGNPMLLFVKYELSSGSQFPVLQEKGVDALPKLMSRLLNNEKRVYFVMGGTALGDPSDDFSVSVRASTVKENSNCDFYDAGHTLLPFDLILDDCDRAKERLQELERKGHEILWKTYDCVCK